MSGFRENDFVVVRTYGAGVHCGFVEKIEGRLTVLRDARRIWRWSEARTLHELANNGAGTKRRTRISEPVSLIELPTTIERVACTNKAQENLCVSRWLDG